ncbi:hypothetical protein O4J56_03935 [Nocardiopsis sp. RSe5-2]|uniref:Uncharacterized protein n=1 Tax=Nocardiopsis endophytica TaxID=3018445 RepID=A0ABT4TZX7_9ACTN|nr:hypothetical protein [Nocardiopsis endophytica]MDA2809780.1 hypothetical protein [Nocardiopsis endophytica]
MAGLLWDDVKDLFDPHTMGSLPDLRVPNTTVNDWQSLLDLIVERGWEHRHSEGDAVVPLPRAQTVLSRAADAECPELRVWPSDGVLAIFRFYAVDEIDFDVDLRELQGQERLDTLCGFLAAIGRCLGRPVLMDPEGDCGHPVLGFDVHTGRVTRLAEPQ